MLEIRSLCFPRKESAFSLPLKPIEPQSIRMFLFASQSPSMALQDIGWLVPSANIHISPISNSPISNFRDFISRFLSRYSFMRTLKSSILYVPSTMNTTKSARYSMPPSSSFFMRRRWDSKPEPGPLVLVHSFLPHTLSISFCFPLPSGFL